MYKKFCLLKYIYIPTKSQEEIGELKFFKSTKKVQKYIHKNFQRCETAKLRTDLHCVFLIYR